MVAKFHQLILLALLVGLGSTSIAYTEEVKPTSATTPASWQRLNLEQRRELLNSYQVLRQLDDKDRQDLQQRMDWFSQLPKDEQQRMREVWQNMSTSEREHWKAQLKTAASPEQRAELREQILKKYDH